MLYGQGYNDPIPFFAYANTSIESDDFIHAGLLIFLDQAYLGIMDLPHPSTL